LLTIDPVRVRRPIAQAAAQSVHAIFVGQLAIHPFDSKAQCEERLTQK
jgi:hypothetical protein